MFAAIVITSLSTAAATLLTFIVCLSYIRPCLNFGLHIQVQLKLYFIYLWRDNKELIIVADCLLKLKILHLNLFNVFLNREQKGR